MTKAVALNLIVAFCFCFNWFSVLENSQSLAQGNRLRVSLGSESANTFSGLAVLAAVLYVIIFSSTLSCISDVVFICFQCTGNHNCFKVFLIWNAIDILITFVCDIALYYMVQSVTSEGYKALQAATDTAEEEVTTSSWDYAQATLIEKFPSGPEEAGPDETTTEVATTRSDSNPKKVIAFTETLRLKPSLSYIFLAAVFKGLVLVMFQQNMDHDDVGGSSCPQHDASSSSLSRIAAWKAQYAQHRSRLQTIWERTLELQSASPADEPEIQQQPHPTTEIHAADAAKPAREPHSRGLLDGQEDVELSANAENVTDKKADIGASPSGKGGESEGFDLSSKLKKELRNNQYAEAKALKPPRQFISDSALRSSTSR